jgi:hypothetical protein
MPKKVSKRKFQREMRDVSRRRSKRVLSRLDKVVKRARPKQAPLRTARARLLKNARTKRKKK